MNVWGLKLLDFKKILTIIVLLLLFVGLCIFTLTHKQSAPMAPVPKVETEKVEKVIPAGDFVILNNKNFKYHKRDCKYGLKAKDFKIVSEKDLPKGATPCKYCHKISEKFSSNSTQIPAQKQIALPQPPLVYATSDLKMFLTDLTSVQKPKNNCSTPLCNELLTQINSAQSSIDFAIYGYVKIPALQTALENALARGVEVRLVFDIDANGANIYPDTMPLSQIIKKFQADYGSNSIMHNKFFIFDKKIVMTGSANLSDTDMSGFNTNSVVFIKSNALAEFYTKEFEQMYNKNFHGTKTAHQSPEGFEGYFSPQDKIITKTIIPMVKNSKKYIYMPVFLITHQNLADALIEAKNRGVVVKIIVDATNSRHKASAINRLRASGVQVKVENYAGKVHSKSMIIDDLYTIIGSMNFSKSGESFNDENVLILKDKDIAIFYRNFFNYLWSKIPNKYLTNHVRAESLESVGSCFDGIDNNFDGKIDAQDIGCMKK